MNQEIFQVPSTIFKVTTLADHTLRLTVDTVRELPPEDEAKIMALRSKQGWFVYAESEIKQEDLDLPEIEPEFKGDKSPSRRLRGVLFVLWEQRGKVGTFEEFYKIRMEQLIDKIKSKLH
jgi:hypothetical protein